MINQTFEQLPDPMWVTAVQVATVWTEPQSARDIDAAGISNPTDIDDWINHLSYEESLALCNENRVQTQVLYGDPVEITAVKDDWAHVVIPSQPSHKDERGYPGWIPLKQLKKVAKKDWQTDQLAAVKLDKAWLESETGEKVMKLSYMTMLPVKSSDSLRTQVITPHGIFVLPTEALHIFPTEKGITKGNGNEIVKAVEPFQTLDYFWGGMSSFGYDCSGLAYAAHKANGYQIARDAGDQANGGEPVKFNQLQPGDLLFFAYEEGKGSLHHVGIYYGHGRMLHSPQTGKGIEIITLAGTKYEKELCAARRYWHNEGEQPA
ncbi:C40 family peptidase [Oceanobacillus sp. FSL K6-2867]|uniref:C40 family peptidase n=1 Tax=Oceanobacillus sp. FSL K6-2867 TaxID=2954748 RepID=UPI0030DD205A